MGKLLSLTEAAAIASELMVIQLTTKLAENEQSVVERLGSASVGFFIDNNESRAKLSSEQAERLHERGFVHLETPAPAEGKRISLVADCKWQLASEDAFRITDDEDGWLDLDSGTGNVYLGVIVFRDTGEALANWHTEVVRRHRCASK